MSADYVDLTLSDEDGSLGHNNAADSQWRGSLSQAGLLPARVAHDALAATSDIASSGYRFRNDPSGLCRACAQQFDNLLDHWKEVHSPTHRRVRENQAAQTAVSNNTAHTALARTHHGLPVRSPGTPVSTSIADDILNASSGAPVEHSLISKYPPRQWNYPTDERNGLAHEMQRADLPLPKAGIIRTKAFHTAKLDQIRQTARAARIRAAFATNIGVSLHGSDASARKSASDHRSTIFKRRRVEDGNHQVTAGAVAHETPATALTSAIAATQNRPSTKSVAQPRSPAGTATQDKATTAQASTGFVENASRHGVPYNDEEDKLLYDLRQQGISWAEIPQYFQGRTLGSLQVRYTNKLSKKARHENTVKTKGPRESSRNVPRPRSQRPSHSPDRDSAGPPLSMNVIPKLRRRAVGGALKHQSNPVSQLSLEDDEDLSNASDSEESVDDPTSRPVSLLRLTRSRELGTSSARGRCIRYDRLQFQNIAYESLGTTKYMDDTSGDVGTVAWSPDDHLFAAGGVVLMDESSMQYNRPRNLLVGDRSGAVRELPEHYVQRPNVTKGVNSLHSMRQTQDERLFTTVQMVGFSPDNQHLYSVSTDGKLNSYNTSGRGASKVEFENTVTHQGPVDLLSVGRHGLIATGCRSSQSNSIGIFQNDGESISLRQSLSSRSSETKDVSYASALKWGVAPNQSKWLLAGFGQEKERLYREDSDLDILGECCLFDGETGQRLDLRFPRNVFDVAWNPNLGHSAFAIASVGFGKVNTGMHTVVRVCGEGQAGIRCTVELECPARDINDLIYCPYDENLVAAGSTDGKIYVWDIRSTKTSQDPQIALSHGNCLSVLPHDRKRWEVDTGVRFLSWGANHTRLFSGSSDGVVKVWNPYVNNEDTHVRNIATFSSAIMSGAFNSDHTQLLIGEDQSRLNLLEVGASDILAPERLSLLSAPEPSTTDPAPHRALLENGEVVFEHFGALPIRQAVQGPNYKPPKDLLTPSEAELHQRALRFQRDLFHQRNRWKRLKRTMAEEGTKIHPCALDCGYTPRVDGDGDGIPDSGRAADRIPAALRGEPEKGLRAFARGLVAKCSACGAPARPHDQGVVSFCERCAFACFRCGGRAELSVARDEVGCAECSVTWRADVLGYEIVSHGVGRESRKVKEGLEKEQNGNEEEDEEEDHFNDAELEHYLGCTA